MPEKRIATVTQINNYIKALLDRVDVIQNIWIRGEISNFKLHSSGHIYMTLKDEGAVLRAVMFKSAAMRLSFRPENGMKVSARGRIGVFERDGQYQLYIEEMEIEGQGDLYRLFEELKKKLAGEGIFDEKHKKPIPAFPQRVGIVTSPTGAAVRDIINILRRRYPVAEAVLYPALVQGQSASSSIVRAIEYFNREERADVLIVGRGGGSIEDLWAFNEEATVRAIYASEIPVISAVGHETDFTLSDFAADLRAPTPSAAAELAVPEIREIYSFTDECSARLRSLLLSKAEARDKQLKLLTERASFTNFSRRLETLMQESDRAAEDLVKAYESAVKNRMNAVSELMAGLDALSPLKVFDRGYSTAMKGGKAVRHVKDVKIGDTVEIILGDGKIGAEVKYTEEAERYGTEGA